MRPPFPLDVCAATLNTSGMLLWKSQQRDQSHNLDPVYGDIWIWIILKGEEPPHHTESNGGLV